MVVPRPVCPAWDPTLLKTINFYESFGYSFFGPLLGLSGIDKTLGYISYHFFGVIGEEIWIQLDPIITLLSSIPIALYSWLALRESPLQRLAGSMALVTGLIFFTLLWEGGAISLDSRHYQPVAMLFRSRLQDHRFKSTPHLSKPHHSLLGSAIWLRHCITTPYQYAVFSKVI